jgi:alpha-tubulin suppressor-like RCC1 family protein
MKEVVSRPPSAAAPAGARSGARRLGALLLTLAATLAVGCGASGSAADFGGTTSDGSSGAGAASGGGGSAGTGGGSILLPPLTATALALGATHTCALLSSGEVACWGDGSLGQLGDGMAAAGYHRATAAKIPGLTGVTAIRAGGGTTCAIVAGAVSCWGDGTYGQLGDGMAAAGHVAATPTPVPSLADVVDLSVGEASVCAVETTGSVHCWGRNTPAGWLGFTSPDCGPYAAGMDTIDVPCETTPRAVPAVSHARAIAAGGDHTCAIVSGETVVCWGADDFGQLGDGFSGTALHPAAPVAVAGFGGVVRLAAGTSHSCAIGGPNRVLSCWGDDAFGQLGTGTNALDPSQAKPVALAGLDQLVDVDAALGVSCAVSTDGTVRCWGAASHLFPPGSAATLAPTLEPGVANAVAVRTGGSHACALRADQTVLCWGLNDSGQLGDGTLSLGEFDTAPVPAP